MRGLLLALFLFSIIAHSQNSLPFKVGEQSSFEISFRGITVGSAEMEIASETKIDSISTFHITGKGRTAPFFDLFFKVRDVYETYLDTSKVRPIRFIRDIQEGGFEKKQLYNFKHADGLVFCKDTSYLISSNSQDMLSALFYARTFNKDSVKQKTSFFVPVFIDEENYSVEIVYMHNEKVKTNFGGIDCMVFRPKMQEGRVFQDGEKMKLWISDDRNNLLVKVETQIWAGTIKAILTKFKEVKYPLSISK
jgi:hypothetical protein